MRVFAVALLLGTLGCGSIARRPMELRIEGLSGLAQTLVLTLADGTGDPRCPAVDLDNVQTVDGVESARWTRDDDMPREIGFDALDLEAVDAIVHTEDDAGTPIQLACRRFTYADLETPFQTLALSRVE
ncbi:MAG: hypothetical protein RIT81_29125 [Deltaproteobacteria bacterium]